MVIYSHIFLLLFCALRFLKLCWPVYKGYVNNTVLVELHSFCKVIFFSYLIFLVLGFILVDSNSLICFLLFLHGTYLLFHFFNFSFFICHLVSTLFLTYSLKLDLGGGGGVKLRVFTWWWLYLQRLFSNKVSVHRYWRLGLQHLFFDP